MTIAKGLSSGYQPIGGSIISDTIAAAFEKNNVEFNHGYTYSGHPVAAAVALENIRILEAENIIDKVRDTTSLYLEKAWKRLEDHPLVGEARTIGMLGAIELSPDPSTRAPFNAPEGTIGLITREICIKNGLIMRHVYDKMIISPPLIISEKEIDMLVSIAWSSLDEAERNIKEKGLMKVGKRN